MDATKLWQVVDVLEGWVAIQRDTASLEKWTDRSFMKFSIGKGQVIHLGKNNFMHRYQLGAGWLESVSEEKGLEILVIDKVIMDRH